MSIIAWDGKALAADRQCTTAEMRQTTRKLWRMRRDTGDVVLLAATGDLSEGMEIRDWYVRGADPARWPASQRSERWSRLIVFAPDRGLFMFEREPVEIPIMDEFCAWGIGRDFAIGAMARGATAREAVEIACRFSVYCGMGIDEFSTQELGA